jgi:cytochrome c-type biogenesis protein CcmH
MRRRSFFAGRAILAVLTMVLLTTMSGQIRANAYTEGASLPPAQEVRYRALLKDLRCLVCQNESLADSDAPLATDLRTQVRGMIVKGDSDDQIRKYLTDRYGDFVLYKPPFQRNTWLLWGGPFLLVIGGLIMMLSYVRRNRRVARAPKVNEDALRKLLEEQR